MKRYGVDELRAALAALDARLDAPATVTLIGGAAVALVLDDRDLVTKDITRSASRARCAPPPGASRSRSTPPRSRSCRGTFEDRRLVLLRHRFLEVLVPEAHDLALSKAVRWSEGDEDHVRRLHAHAPLRFDTLVERYATEMGHAVGDPRRRRASFLDCIEALFGEVARLRAAERVSI